MENLKNGMKTQESIFSKPIRKTLTDMCKTNGVHHVKNGNIVRIIDLCDTHF